MNITDREAFDEFIGGIISSERALFKINRRDNSACTFLTEDNLCSIHPAKPLICELFMCSPNEEDESDSCWLSSCTHSKPNAELLEFSFAVELTKVYVQRNGVNWNEVDYSSAIQELKKGINNPGSKRVFLLHDFAGRPGIKTFDCNLCDAFDNREVETPVTLDDINRIMYHLKIDGNTFFVEYVSSKPSRITGGLKLIGGRNCVFRSPEDGRCTICQVRPLHCRFTSCPAQIHESKTWDRLYQGSGTIEEQFRNQLALSITREYVAQCGTVFNGPIFEKKLDGIERLCSIDSEQQAYCMKLDIYNQMTGAIPIIALNF